MLEHALPSVSQNPQSMRIVDHQPRLLPLLQFDQSRQVTDVAVHAVQPFRDDQHAFVAVADRLQHRIERREVIVRE